MTMKPFVLSLTLGGFIFFFYASPGNSPNSQYRDIALPPVATFNTYCARCHGYEGSAYGHGFASIGDSSLKNITEDMLFGPAGLNPDSLSIGAMVAYNRALSRKKPFASVLNTRRYFDKLDSFLYIETSPGTIVKDADSVGGRSQGAAQWRIPHDRNKEEIFQITASRMGDSVVIQFPKDLWSR